MIEISREYPKRVYRNSRKDSMIVRNIDEEEQAVKEGFGSWKSLPEIQAKFKASGLDENGRVPAAAEVPIEKPDKIAPETIAVMELPELIEKSSIEMFEKQTGKKAVHKGKQTKAFIEWLGGE